jgi:regulator of protease activity HflC (stomatin/prohibitin superfamily)
MNVLFQFLIGFFWELWPFAKVEPWEQGVGVFWGKYCTRKEPGIYLRYPLIETVETLDVVTQVVDLGNQVVHSADDTPWAVSGTIEYRIADVVTLYKNVQDHDEAMQTVAMIELASFIGAATDDEITAGTLESEALPAVQHRAERWGIEVDRVAITHLAECRPYYILSDGSNTTTLVDDD